MFSDNCFFKPVQLFSLNFEFGDLVKFIYIISYFCENLAEKTEVMDTFASPDVTSNIALSCRRTCQAKAGQ